MTDSALFCAYDVLTQVIRARHVSDIADLCGVENHSPWLLKELDELRAKDHIRYVRGRRECGVFITPKGSMWRFEAAPRMKQLIAVWNKLHDSNGVLIN